MFFYKQELENYYLIYIKDNLFFQVCFELFTSRPKFNNQSCYLKLEVQEGLY